MDERYKKMIPSWWAPPGRDGLFGEGLFAKTCRVERRERVRAANRAPESPAFYECRTLGGANDAGCAGTRFFPLRISVSYFR